MSFDSNDLKKVENFAKYDYVGQLITRFLEDRFSVGDTLIRYPVNDKSRTPELVSKVCPVPKKFRVVHIDSLGLPWVKQICVRGGLGKEIICPIKLTYYKWEMDPEQLECLLLDMKYDARVEYKRLRDNDPRYGQLREDD